MARAIKLFIPGPIEVSEKTWQAFRRPMIGHRSKAFQELYASVQPSLQKLFFTKNPVFLSTSSAWGVMEGAVRNLCSKKTLNAMNGAFSDKWNGVSASCAKAADKLQFEWGKPVRPEAVREKLKAGGYDVFTMIHNETSTGTMSPIAEIAEVMREFPDVMFVVDAVSSLSAVPVEMDKLGIDVLLVGCQKAIALPPGLTLFSVSERALKRADSVGSRGYYFDFVEFLKNHQNNMTPSTPSVSHIYALQSKMEEMMAEGLDRRFARHREMQKLAHDWVAREGLEFFAEKGCESVSLTCVRNNRKIDVPKMIERLKERYACVIDGGYGKLKGETFRISHMGDETPSTISQLLGWLDDCLKGL
ncbi:MAG: alanine--glyoxylate aminotransferase family protein [Verrucomicrobiae bacterium]|nr:alanine--glyoxylate aminotransferase family protein [Verrucomicrobiae bacterium]